MSNAPPISPLSPRKQVYSVNSNALTLHLMHDENESHGHNHHMGPDTRLSGQDMFQNRL